MPFREGRHAIADLIEEGNPAWRTAKLTYVLRFPASSGPSYERRMRRVAGGNVGALGATATLGSLTDRQREFLVLAIRRTA